MWDKSSWPERVVVVWGLLIASSAVLYVAVSLSNLISENSSNIANWVQAIGSIAAILATGYGVWWQMNKQLSAAEDLRILEAVRKSDSLKKRSLFLLEKLRLTCERIKAMHFDFLQNQKLQLLALASQGAISMPTFAGSSKLLQGDWDVYEQLLNLPISHLSDLPYWEIEDSDLANDMISIKSISLMCMLSLNGQRDSFFKKLESLIENIAAVESNFS